MQRPAITKRARHALRVLPVLAAALLTDISHARPSSRTLDAIRARDHVTCAVGDGPAGYSAVTPRGHWSGMGVDFCRALASAVFGDRDAVKFHSAQPRRQLQALRAGDVDVLARYTPGAPGADDAQGIRLAGVLLYEGQGFMVPRSQNIASALELSGARVCLSGDGTAARHVPSYFAGLNMPIELVRSDSWAASVAAYGKGACHALSADLSALALGRQHLADPGEHHILPELAYKQAVGPAVRSGDDEWFSVVRWTLYALISAEQLGITSATVDGALTSTRPEIRRFLGIDTDLGKRLGLNADWTQHVIRQVGNYGELYERNLGQKSALRLERRLNSLSSNGGLHYAPSF